MEGRMTYTLNVFLTILIVCYSGTVISRTTLSSTVQTTIVPSSVPSTEVPSTKTTTALPSSVPTTVSGTCESLGYVYNVESNYYPGYWSIPSYNNEWYNMSFWGGNLQIPWKENLDDECFYWSASHFLTLIDKHKDIADIGEEILTFDACILNQNQSDNCILDVSVEMRKCNGNLLYRIPWKYSHIHDYDPNIYYNTYICFDRKYTVTCESSDFVYTAGNVNGSFLDIWYSDYQLGWLDAHRDGKQYVLPSFEDVEDVFENCHPGNSYYYNRYFLEEVMSQDIRDVPVRLRLCNVYKYFYGNYDNYNENENDYYYDNNCNEYVYARKCDGKIQFDISMFRYWGIYICFIHYNNVKVLPEIGHKEEKGNGGSTIYSPFLQFRCSFGMDGTAAYRVNWYINGTLWIKTGPSFEAEDLVFKGESLNELRLGYQVKCGVIAVGTNGSSESFSDEFYAGWKISDTSLKLSKNGHAFVEVEQTVPLGCAHTVTGQEKCEEMLSLEDPKQTPDVACKAGIYVLNADDDSGDLSYHKIKSLKIGEKWNENKKYRFRLSTIDHNYDDKLYFEMKLLVTMTTRQTPRVHSGRDTLVVVTNSEVNRNKRCYSHVDPHMRTADGRYYEQQREGDHMLYRNLAYQTEVQEYARYCNQDYTNGPVCACGVAIRSGADVFMINRCGNFTFLDFKECGDGGILDVERVHDYHYKVTTPIGTIVDISLHRWGKTMNIDIYLSAKDFGNMDGLCGYFDGDNTNDFRHRDGVTVSNGNNDYAFSNSWRLSDEENFLKNDNRLLEKWKKNNGGNRPCSRPESITKNKCKFERRKRREVIVRKGKEKSRQEIMPVAEKIREKRSTGYDISDEKARTICNSSIYEAPAVRDFSDKLADEDPEVVLSQCVYDIVQGNDTVWAGAHVNALNNIATSVISLNPAFAASNSVSVKKFLSQTCLNNCSGHGECSEIGLCTCGGNFRGPDCGIDLRIPPIIYDIQDGGMCDTANDSECDCFVIRTDNIFEGFTYEIDTYELLFDGTRKQIGKSVNVGEYEDVFTGVCCIPEQRKKRSVDDSSDPSIMRFDVVISNDGNNFGQSKSVYVFDSTCVHFEHSGGIVTIVLKDGYCFIGGACVEQKSTLQTPSGCYVCEPKSIPYAWKHVSCGRDNAGLATSTLAAVITGSVFAGIILMALVVYVRCFKGSKKLRTVEDIQTSQAYMSPGPAKKFLGYKWMSPNREMTE